MLRRWTVAKRLGRQAQGRHLSTPHGDGPQEVLGSQRSAHVGGATPRPLAFPTFFIHRHNSPATSNPEANPWGSLGVERQSNLLELQWRRRPRPPNTSAIRRRAVDGMMAAHASSLITRGERDNRAAPPPWGYSNVGLNPHRALHTPDIGLILPFSGEVVIQYHAA